MEAFLRALLPRLLPSDRTYEVHPHQGKLDLLGKLEGRLRGYARWLQLDSRIFVVVDRDEDDCLALKQQLENAAACAGLRTRSGSSTHAWQVVNRIAIEELEAWYFGDWGAVRGAYPKVPPTIPHRAQFRHPDNIRGGTWEAFERVLQRAGYFRSGLRKTEAARAIGSLIDTGRNSSRSFSCLLEAIVEATA